MYEQFIEFTNQIFWEGYAEQLAKENPARFQQEISDFLISINAKIMNDRIYLLVRCTVKTKHRLIHDAIKELQDGTNLQLTNTENVEILQTEIVKMNTKSKN